MVGNVIHARRERSPAWVKAWDTLDEIERLAVQDIEPTNTKAAGRVVDAVQEARRHLMDAIA